MITSSSRVADGRRVVTELTGPSHSDLVVLERKGEGHPDTLADQLAERLSAAYSQYTRDQFGAILHHNFDKLAILGGSSEVAYGAGSMLRPVRVLLNGRVTESFAGEVIPSFDIARQVVAEFFADRLPELEDHLLIVNNLTSNSSPGSVRVSAQSDRDRWFMPRSLDDLRERRELLANDTSLGTGWAPLSPVEAFVIHLVNVFAEKGSDFREASSWCGSDVKVMAVGAGERVDVTLCVPQRSPFVRSRAEYIQNSQAVLERCELEAARALAGYQVTFQLNARDRLESDELYLTYSGSSIESGDEGVVGRGNRINGLITPMRPMNMEGANGKNPVYHVGKLYNVLATRIASALVEVGAGRAEVHLVSATGSRLDQPWQTILKVQNAIEEATVDRILDRHLSTIPELTDEFLRGAVQLT